MGAPTTVAVVSWNTRELLDRCLQSLAHDAAVGRAEVWVVDNASTDGSEHVVRSHPFAHLIESEANLGFGAAVNLVAEQSSSPWLAAANADVEIMPGTLEQMLKVGLSQPLAGAVAPRLVFPNGVTQHSVYSFPTLPTMALYNSGLLNALPWLGDRLAHIGKWDPSRPRWVDWAVGAFVLVRRAAWDEVGGFDPEQWMYAEDLDLGWRLKQRGWRTWYEPTAVVLHNESAATLQAWGELRHDRRLRSTYEWLLRRRGRARACATAALNVSGAVVRALIAELRARRRPTHQEWRRGMWQAARGHARGLKLTALTMKPGAKRQRP
jgi:N-acetylglucosaminyl-diphospho-decaprenol L-rhamnosyltransferase